MSKKDIWKNIGNFIKYKKIDLLITVLIGLMFYSSNLFKNAEITKLWFELIGKIISWPVAILIIFLRFHIPIIALVSKISKLKIGGNEVIFFETLEKIEESFDNEINEQDDGVDDLTEELSEYELLASIEPRAAILQTWGEYEKLLRDKFNKLIEEKGLNYYNHPKRKFLSVSEMMFQLLKNELIDRNSYEHSKELNYLRNMIAHGEDVDTSTEMALEYNKTLGKLKKYINGI